ncbi:hypothetical protein Tco_0611735 [Tanacetum coccineum]
MDDPNITIEEYIRLEEEKSRRRGKVYNWETAKYGKIWYDKDVHDLRFVETKFLTIVFNDTLMSEPTVSSPNNNKIDFIISFDESDGEDYIDETSLSECDEEEQNVLNFNDLFPFNVIYPNDSKSDKDNDDDKVHIEHSSGNLFVKPLPDVGAYAQGPNKLLETSHDKSNKIFKAETFIKELNVNINLESS